MQIFVRTLGGKTLTLECTNVLTLKLKLQDLEGVPAHLMQLSSAGSLLLDDSTLLDESTVQMGLPILGGGKKKRKKKTFTKPKKQKHKKKKVKLAVLKYYKVDENGKITRLRRECTEPGCGAATFMAIHYDRYTCGRCGATLVYTPEREEKTTTTTAKGKA